MCFVLMSLLVTHIFLSSLRVCLLRYSGPGIILKHCYPKGKHDLVELGSRFKASHVKGLLWWLALTAAKACKEAPCVSRLSLGFGCL